MLYSSLFFALVCFMNLAHCAGLFLLLYQFVTVIFAIASGCYVNLWPLLGLLDLPLSLHWLVTLNCSSHQFVTFIFVSAPVCLIYLYHCTGLLH